MKHSIEINLDDNATRAAFLAEHGTLKGRSLANRLGLAGKGSSILATALSNYAWNAHTAHNLRLQGKIATAKTYEDIADNIYARKIAPLCECW